MFLGFRHEHGEEQKSRRAAQRKRRNPMKTTFTTNSIRAALVLLATSAAMARGFQENNAAAAHQRTQAPRPNAAAPARSSTPARAAAPNRSMPASVRTPSSTPTTKTASTGSSAGKGTTVSKGTTQTNPGTSTGYTNTNINKNTNINVNRNTNSNAWNTGSGTRQNGPTTGSISQGRGTNQGGPQRTAFNGNTNSNTNINRNTNVNINKNVNVNQNGGRGSGMVHNSGPRIDDGHFRSHFGRDHEFHAHPQMVDGRPRFQYSGVSFGLMAPLPASWSYNDAVYVDFVGGSYFLCNRMYPGVRVPVDIGDCASCTQTPDLTANNVDCADCGASSGSADGGSVPTLVPGETASQVVAALGTPKDIVDLGMRKIYLYGDMRVTFVGGRLSDVR
jgi:hypothetical protein